MSDSIETDSEQSNRAVPTEPDFDAKRRQLGTDELKIIPGRNRTDAGGVRRAGY